MSSGLLVPPDVGVDRLVADRELALTAQAAGDLLWAPVGFKLLLHQGEVGLCEVLVSSRPGSSSVRSLDGLARPVEAIATRAVPLEFSRYRAAVATQAPRNLGRAKSFPPQRRDGVSFFRGDLVICH